MVTKTLMKQNNQPGISLEFRAPCLNGNVDSYQDSTDLNNSRNQIDSFNHMNTMGVKTQKKDSIYKTALSKGGSSKFIPTQAKQQNEFDSFYSNASSKEDMDNDSARGGSKNMDKDKGSESSSRDGSVEMEDRKGPIRRSRFGRDV